MQYLPVSVLGSGAERLLTVPRVGGTSVCIRTQRCTTCLHPIAEEGISAASPFLGDTRQSLALSWGGNFLLMELCGEETAAGAVRGFKLWAAGRLCTSFLGLALQVAWKGTGRDTDSWRRGGGPHRFIPQTNLSGQSCSGSEGLIDSGSPFVCSVAGISEPANLATALPAGTSPP